MATITPGTEQWAKIFWWVNPAPGSVQAAYVAAMNARLAQIKAINDAARAAALPGSTQ